MQTIIAREHNILPEEEIGNKLSKLLSQLKNIKEEKTLVFEKGTYYINRNSCDKKYYAITNTVGKKEFKDPADINMHYIGFHLNNINNLTIEGNGAQFIIQGKMTNAVISKCKNITFKNLSFHTENPNMHKLTVKKKSPFSADFELDSTDQYKKKDGSFVWYGNGYELGFCNYMNSAYWNATIKPSNPHRISRNAHPFRASVSIKETKPYNFHVNYLFHPKFEIGQTFYIFDSTRSDAGVFAEQSENIKLIDVEQTFNYSLAFVAQDCTDITLDSLRFAPKKDSKTELTSLADFIQICMCSGDVNITNCCFDGSADDTLNVHGIHYKVTNTKNNKITVKYCHDQTWGWDPLHENDKIEFINTKTMLCEDENTIIRSRMIDDYHIELKLKKALKKDFTGYVIEDIDRCPNIYFANNTMDRIITRSLLLTTRGKVVVENNKFINSKMSSIVISDDAKSWYESGMCKDVTIKNNEFISSGNTPIIIKPENKIHAGAVHQNIIIENNYFKEHSDKHYFWIKSTSNITIKNNKFIKKPTLYQQNVSNLTKDF